MKSPPKRVKKGYSPLFKKKRGKKGEEGGGRERGGKGGERGWKRRGSEPGVEKKIIFQNDGSHSFASAALPEVGKGGWWEGEGEGEREGGEEGREEGNKVGNVIVQWERRGDMIKMTGGGNEERKGSFSCAQVEGRRGLSGKKNGGTVRGGDEGRGVGGRRISLQRFNSEGQMIKAKKDIIDIDIFNQNHRVCHGDGGESGGSDDSENDHLRDILATEVFFFFFLLCFFLVVCLLFFVSFSCFPPKKIQ